MKGLPRMLKNIFLGLMALMLMTTFFGCQKSCSVNCLHNGTCNGSTCSCPDPYSGYNCDTMCTLGLEGYMCQTPSRNKFLGTWAITSTDQTGNSKSYLITFTTNPYNLFTNMNYFNQNSSYPIICTLTGKNSFSIDQTQQDTLAMNAGVSGSGQLSNGKLVINVYENNNVSFFATATKQ